MTKPDPADGLTQAQLEAAAIAAREAYNNLTTDWKQIALAALTAAAEVGPDPSGFELIEQLGKERDVRLATIERCAQVARKYIDDLIDPQSKTMSHWDQIRQQCEDNKGSDFPRLNFEGLIETIAEDTEAAIRALKEKE